MPETDLFYEITSLKTEQKNPRTEDIDKSTTIEILKLINDEDITVAHSVRKELDFIAEAVDRIVFSFKNNGRLIYVGAGTSGRLGVVDASECPPTFGSEPNLVRAIIAGGHKAVFQAQEGAEDSKEYGAFEIEKLNITKFDTVCGIAASGRTPFVIGALEKAKQIGAFTIILATVPKSQLKINGIKVDLYICPEVGPEVIAGSTRMKSGTAQKLVLNMLTTASFVRIGKTFGNVMVDLQQTNAKLKERSKKILMSLTGVNYDESEEFLIKSKGNVKTALVMILANCDYVAAIEKLEKADGFVKKALEY